MTQVLSMVAKMWLRLEQAVAASRRREAHRILEHIAQRRQDLARRARIGSY